MTRLFRTCRVVLPALLLAAAGAQAQLPGALPMAGDPARAAYAPSAALLAQAAQARPAALALPFFDDFTVPVEGAPRVQNWVPGGGALVNNRFAIQPLTRGTATLDGIRANGASYSGVVTSAYGIIDSLTSQPVDLGGLTVNDQVALSFAWQSGSIAAVPGADTPARPINLEVFAKTSAGTWESLVVIPSLGLRVTGFKQRVLLLNQARFLHGAFQFRFVARGNTSNNRDTWNVDYVLLNRGRSRGLADTTFTDRAIGGGLKGGNPSGGLRSPLRRSTAMPVWQFNAAIATELTTRLGVNLVNLSPGVLPVPVAVQGSVRNLTTGAALGTWLQDTRALRVNPRLDSVTGSAARQPIPLTPAPKVLRYTLALTSRDSAQSVLVNDTISRDVNLTTYYAYDDGTAENFTQLPAFGTGQAAAYAYRFDLNQPDHVRSLRLYPVFTASDRSPRTVTVSVWDDANGQPGAQPRASKTDVIPYPPVAGWDYYEISFDPPVPVSGSFYVGYSQPSVSRDLHYGLDLNSRYPGGHLWYRNNVGAWDSIPYPQLRGALMMRPVMSNTVATATAAGREAAAFRLYPNPAHGPVTVAGPPFAGATVLDAVGRAVWTQPAAEAGRAALSLPALPPGVYTVRLTLPDGATVGRRLLLE